MSRLKLKGIGGGVLAILSVVTLIICLVFAGEIVERVDDSQVKVFQSPIAGTMTVHNTPGLKYQGFADVKTYNKRDQIIFTQPEGMAYEDKEAKLYGLPLRFNDKGGAVMYSTFSYTLSPDPTATLRIRSKYSSIQQLEEELIKPVITKAVYMTGPTMSSEESTASKRSLLIEYVMDQINEGPYKMKMTEIKATDTLSGQEKTITIAQIVKDVSAPNGRARQELSPLKEFGITVFNPEIKKIKYDPQVEKQIEAQRQITMNIATAIASAKEAEQNTIKEEEQGKARAAKAKWAQEEINAKDIAMAEKKLTVAKLDEKAAEHTKKKDILLGQGEAEKKKLIMSADGALEKKLATYERVSAMYAKAMAEYKGNWVPQIQTGGSNATGSGQNAGLDMMEILSIKAAKDLALDLQVQ